VLRSLRPIVLKKPGGVRRMVHGEILVELFVAVPGFPLQFRMARFKGVLEREDLEVDGRHGAIVLGTRDMGQGAGAGTDQEAEVGSR